MIAYSWIALVLARHHYQHLHDMIQTMIVPYHLIDEWHVMIIRLHNIRMQRACILPSLSLEHRMDDKMGIVVYQYYMYLNESIHVYRCPYAIYHHYRHDEMTMMMVTQIVQLNVDDIAIVLQHTLLVICQYVLCINHASLMK